MRVTSAFVKKPNGEITRLISATISNNLPPEILYQINPKCVTVFQHRTLTVRTASNAKYFLRTFRQYRTIHKNVYAGQSDNSRRLFFATSGRFYRSAIVIASLFSERARLGPRRTIAFFKLHFKLCRTINLFSPAESSQQH